MDLSRTIQELQKEKRRLDQAIVVLEQLLDHGTASIPAGRRGRKSMSAEERLQVSQRMQRYWAARRAGNQAMAAVAGAESVVER